MKRSMLSRGLVVVALGAWALAPVAAQQASRAATSASKAGAAPRTPEGHPDLQGNWNFATVTPLERPAQFAGKETLSTEEAAAFAKETVDRTDADRRTPGTTGDVGLAYNQFWYDRGTKTIGTNRTSLIVEPRDGRLPAQTPDAQKAAATRAEIRRGNTEGPETRSLSERCLVFNAGPPLLPGPYNNNIQIVQTKDYVVIASEMIHDVRIVPLDGRPHAPGAIRNWFGDARGRWEGDTLVVESTNFGDKTATRGTDKSLHLIERFTRVSGDMLDYQFTIDDPSAFVKPWTVSLPMSRLDERIYEYACHEGNYGMEGMLKSARATESEQGAR